MLIKPFTLFSFRIYILKYVTLYYNKYNEDNMDLCKELIKQKQSAFRTIAEFSSI